MHELQRKYRGTVVAVTPIENLGRAIQAMLEETKKADFLMERFPKGTFIAVDEVPYVGVVEGHVIRYDGFAREICVRDHEYGEVWIPLQTLKDQEVGYYSDRQKKQRLFARLDSIVDGILDGRLKSRRDIEYTVHQCRAACDGRIRSNVAEDDHVFESSRLLQRWFYLMMSAEL